MDFEFVKGQFTEEVFEEAIISLFDEQDIKHVSGEKMHRRFEDIIIEEDLRAYLVDRYSDLTESEVKRIIGRLENIPSSPLYKGNKETFLLINEGFDMPREDVSSIALHVDYIHFDKPNKNIIKVVNQYTVQGERQRRPDLLLFINGIPMVIFEFKSAIREDASIHDAWLQITNRYTRDIPKLMKYCFISVISDGANNRMGSIFTPYEYYYAWNKINDEERTSDGISSLLTMIRGAFTKERVLSILRDFIFYPDDSSDEEVIVTRYPQYFAAQKMFENIKRHLKPDGDGKGGTYFGATGCGKTYAMLFLSRLLTQRDRNTFENPTIIVITDRDDLDRQATDIFATAKRYLRDENVRSMDSRVDLQKTLGAASDEYRLSYVAENNVEYKRPQAITGAESGGVYLTTIQKFCESIGLLSDRSNIICLSDEAHRTHLGVGSKLKKTDEGVFVQYGLAKYLRDSFPNATYCGFTGTPIDETIAVFGDVVDSYTMKESSDDGITVRIAYEPRLARVLLSDDQAREIQEYYNECIELGSNPEQVEESKRAMSKLRSVLSHPIRIKKLAADIVEHYEMLTAQKPEIVQKAMIVCADRQLAFQVWKEIITVRPEWNIVRKSDNESGLSEVDLEKLIPLEKIKLIATRADDDDRELYNLCGTKEHRQMLDKQFKKCESNFKIAIVVDMWITGFDVPSLSVMYIDKPLQKHTLVQTISRVNRVFEGKDMGLVIDYIGIKDDMMAAVKQYGKPQDSPIDEMQIAMSIFRNHLVMIDEALHGFNATRFFHGVPLERLHCLNDATQYVQLSKELQNRFMNLSRRLKAAYDICFPTGELSDIETAKAQFYLAIRSIIYKQTIGDVPDAEIMNRVVEQMVQDAITCTGIENIVNAGAPEDLSGSEFAMKLEAIEMPITKFNALMKLLRKAISDYRNVNKVKAIEFDKRLRNVVDRYNERDALVFTNEVVADFVDGLSDELIKIFNDLREDKTSFEKMGITYEEKAFFDILVKVRDDHKFHYEDEKCLMLAKEIKLLVDDKSQYADWSTREDIKNQLNKDLTVLLYRNGYPPEWDEVVFEKVLEQAENFKRFN